MVDCVNGADHIKRSCGHNNLPDANAPADNRKLLPCFRDSFLGCYGLLRKATLRPVGRRLLAFEPLEDRALLSVSPTVGPRQRPGDVVTVNASQSVGSVGTAFLGVNLVSWDSYLTTSQTQQMVQNAGLGLFRFPGGSESDEFPL